MTNIEVRKAMFQMGPDKAACSYGYPPSFFQKHWEIVGGLVVTFVRGVFRHGRIAKEVNETLIHLLPKVQKPKSLSEFCPISLCNVIKKLISKVLANRL